MSPHIELTKFYIQCTDKLKPRTGAELLIEMLLKRGAETCFAYPGTSELAFCDAASLKGLKVINSRGDKEAVFMAAGANYSNPGSSIALLHGARGLTNSLGAIADVRRSEIPVLCVVGMASRSSAGYLPPHAEPGLLKAAGVFAHAISDCSNVNDLNSEVLLEKISNAFAALAEPKTGPVLLGLPQDVLTEDFLVTSAISVRPASTGRLENLTAIANATKMLKESKRPVILVDDYLTNSGQQTDILLGQLSEAIGAPVFQVAYRRGPMLFQQLKREFVQQYVGYYDPRDQEHRDALWNADLVVTIEDRNMYPRVVGELPSCAKVAITSDPLAPKKNGYLLPRDQIVAGRVREILQEVIKDVSLKGRRGGHCWTGVGRAAKEPNNAAAVAIVRGLAGGIANIRSPVIVDDSQMLGGLISQNYGLLPPEIKIVASHGGFVGGGLSTAVGMALSSEGGDPVLCLLGDQGFTNGIQALGPAAEQGAALVVVVCNNGASVSLRKQARSEAIEAGTNAILQNNEQMGYGAIASGYGFEAVHLVWPSSRLVPLRSRSRPTGWPPRWRTPWLREDRI